METRISKLDGVNNASISFMTQRLIIDADSDRFPTIIDEAQAIISKIEPDCIISR